MDPDVGILTVAENGERVRARLGEMVFRRLALDELVELIGTSLGDISS